MSKTLSFRDVKTEAQALAWAEQLGTRWPQRARLIEYMLDVIEAYQADKPGHVVELCCGAGLVAKALGQKFSAISYTGFDQSDLFLRVAQEQVADLAFASSFIAADLNQQDWPQNLSQPAHFVLSLQSMHDLGNIVQVTRAYRLAYRALAPGGWLLNADFVPALFNPEQAGRLPAAQHLEVLANLGFDGLDIPLKTGPFALIMAQKPK